MAAATTTTAASQKLSPFGKTPGVPRAGTKYPVRGNPSLRPIGRPKGIEVRNFAENSNAYFSFNSQILGQSEAVEGTILKFSIF